MNNELDPQPSDTESVIELKDKCQRLQDRAETAENILKRREQDQWRTADFISIRREMFVYVLADGKVRAEGLEEPKTVISHTPVGKCFSTERAAEAARESEA